MSFFVLPAIGLGVFVPILVDGALGVLSMAIGSALMVAAVVAFFRASKAAQDDYRDPTEHPSEHRAE